MAAVNELLKVYKRSSGVKSTIFSIFWDFNAVEKLCLRYNSPLVQVSQKLHK